MSQVLAVGDCMVEACFLLPSSDSRAPDLALDDCVFACGGSAANFACTMGRLGEPIGLLSHIGDDMFSQMLVADLQAHGVDISQVSQVDGPSSVTAIIIERGGERRFLSFRSPAEPDPAATSVPGVLRDVDWLHISGFVFQRAATAQRARQLMASARVSGIRVSCDPSPLLAEYASPDDREFWASFDVIFPNEYEATALTGIEDSAAAAQMLTDMGVGTVVVTLGPGGCLIRSPAGETSLDGLHVADVRDTTGAGDAFAAGFVAGRRRGASIETSAHLGNLLASQAIRVIGGHGGARSPQALLAESMRDDVRVLLIDMDRRPHTDSDLTLTTHRIGVDPT